MFSITSYQAIYAHLFEMNERVLISPCLSASLRPMSSPEKFEQIVEKARETIALEAETVQGLLSSIDREFVGVVERIYELKGRLVVTGIGKSAIIAQKLVATFVSTGQPALFMHAADAIHGDLGLIQQGDAVLVISKSGDSPEIKFLLPLLKSMKHPVIAMVSNPQSYLALQSDWQIMVPVAKEACPHNLAPTSSTTAQLAMGDALAMALMDLRGFRAEDFAKYHPGGALGKKLYLRMGDLVQRDRQPRVNPEARFNEVLESISKGRMGATAVIREGVLLGIITDGDIRRAIEKQVDIHSIIAEQMMSFSPRTIDSQALAVEGFRAMELHKITQLVVEENGNYIGMVHLHDILKEGIF